MVFREKRQKTKKRQLLSSARDTACQWELAVENLFPGVDPQEFLDEVRMLTTAHCEKMRLLFH